MKKVMTGIAIGFIVLGLLLGAVLAAAIWGGWGFNFGGILDSTAQLANRESFATADIETLEILYRSDSVTFETTGGDEIILEEYMTNPSPDKLAKTSLSGGTLQIEQGERKPLSFAFWNNSYAKVYVPAGWHGALDAEISSGSLRSEASWEFASINLRAKSGSIRFENLVSHGDLNIVCSSGGVSAGDISAKGDCYLEATSGSVRADNVEAKTIAVQSTSGGLKLEGASADTVRMTCSSGSVKLGRVNGEFALSTTSGSVSLEGGSGHGTAIASSGSVRVELGEVSGDVRVETTSGSARLTIPRGLSFNFVGDITSGSIRTDFKEHLAYDENGKHAEGAVGENPEVDIWCKASSGSVNVQYG